jgi:predicted acylesterase/phospholipase RssA
MSSASIPVMFPPMHWNGQIYMDGGTVWNLNVDGAVKACMAKGFAENEIIVDMLSCYPRNVKQEASVSDNALQNYLENRDLNKFYHGTRDTYAQLQAYPEVNFRYYVSNNAPALGLDEINFDTIVTWPLQQNGMA